jgi:hypothetical protein
LVGKLEELRGEAMDAWAEEKRALLATIQRQERDAAKLARRFKLLQHTLVEQQALLDRYQRVLRRQQHGEGVDGSTRVAEQLGETQSTVVGLTVDAPITVGVDGEAVGDQARGEADAGVSSRDAEKWVQLDRTEAEDVETQHHETATYLSPPLAAIEAIPPPSLTALDDAADTGTSVAATSTPPTIGPSATARPEPAQPGTKLREATAKTSEAVGGDSFWTRRRKSELRGDSRASTSVSAAVTDAPTSATGLPAVASASTSMATTKRSRPAPAKWADVKKQRAVGAAVFTPSSGQAAVAARSTDKENREFAHIEVVRNREARAALPAHDCAECARYYAALGDMVSAEQVAEHKRACSRHRARYQPHETPDDFWRLTFPDSEPTT